MAERRASRRRTALLLVVIGLIIAAGVAFGIWRLSGSAPAEVNLDDAVARLDATGGADSTDGDGGSSAGAASTAAAPPTTNSATADAPATTAAAGSTAAYGAEPAAAPATAAASDATDGYDDPDHERYAATEEGLRPDDLIGTWTLAPDIEGSFVGYRVDEELLTIGHKTVVGRTDDVVAEVEAVADPGVAGVAIVGAVVSAELATLTTDDSRRDRRASDALGVANHPLATFRLTQPLDSDTGTWDLSSRQLEADAVGELTVKGVTREVTFEVAGRLSTDGVLVIVGSTDVVFTDYGVVPPSAPIVVSIEDDGVIEFQLYLRRT